MDINQLLYQHQLALLNAAHASADKSRRVFDDLAGYYSRRIREYRHDRGLAQYA